MDSEQSCKSSIERMLRNSQTKVIMPVITLGLLEESSASGEVVFTDSQIRKAYEAAVQRLKSYLGHDFHIGAKYYDAYGSRMSRYGVLKPVGHLKYELLLPYPEHARSLCGWIPERIKEHIEERLGVVPLLHDCERHLILGFQLDRAGNMLIC